MNVKGIVYEYLLKHRYDGLCCDSAYCACQVNDLLPCGELGADCTAGYKVPCPDDCGEHDFHIVEEQPLKTCDTEQ